MFLTRLTPWPIEPALQIWRCPMGVGAAASTDGAAAAIGGSAPGVGDGAPVDEVLASIRVHDIRYRQQEVSGGGMGEHCERSDATRLGTHGPDGGWRWEDSTAEAVPRGPGLSGFAPPGNCIHYRYRAVAVSWTDALGSRGFEEMRY